MQLEPRSYLDVDATIMAPCSGHGASIQILRLSGKEALKGLSVLLQKSVSEIERREARKLYFGRIYEIEKDGQSKRHVIDEVLWVFFPASASFTGEVVVEIHLHGNPWILERVQSILFHLGIQPALRGEFSFRAVYHGKKTWFEAQTLLELFQAKSKDALQRALTMTKASSSWIDDIRLRFQELLASVEVEIDFSDQGLEVSTLDAIFTKINSLILKLNRLAETYRHAQKLQEGYRMVLAGRPNAGKSSLFNVLLGEERTLVSRTPGTTRDTVKESFLVRDDSRERLFVFEDTAGLRVTSDELERMGIERAKRSIRDADLILFVIDLVDWKHESSETLQAWEHLKTFDMQVEEKTIFVFNKIDQTEPTSINEKAFQTRPLVFLSTKTGEGVQALIHTILNETEAKESEFQKEGFSITRSIHRDALEQATKHLERSKTTESLDLIAADLRHALQAMAPILGGTYSDDLLTKIFSDFCIGK